MRRFRPLPTETMAAISFVVVAALVALVVLVRHHDDSDGRVQTADRSTLTTVADDDAPDDADDDGGGGGDQTTTTAPASPPSTVEPPSPPAPPTTSNSTTSTTEVPATKRSAPPTSSVEKPPECPGLVSETYWTSTGERSRLVTAAGGEAGYTEVVRNESDEPCTLTTSRCGSTAELRTADGADTDQPPRACPADLRQEVLEPGAQRIEQLTVSFPVPPGDYLARIRRYDGTVVDLPVRLDDRLAPCPTDTLVLEVNGSRQARSASEIRTSGLGVDLIVRGASPSCTVRMVDGRLRLDGGGEPIELADQTERWLAQPRQTDIYTHIVLPPAEVPVGEYDGTVTILLESGAALSAPMVLLVD